MLSIPPDLTLTPQPHSPSSPSRRSSPCFSRFHTPSSPHAIFPSWRIPWRCSVRRLQLLSCGWVDLLQLQTF
ncbi:uncharacterized protein A1O9_09695 [Exophiala aquamarina CBS 119918]|uniref:Uncharacterized protein n=1 Tax=Exophiala aquamarina CBS 119918 TaxID=1182545 RepID=A0A072P5G2_9EURO|nr:uncharacterized protein A1O9_09695 [Exophiala aquamarina CBS 119918]KEF54528.1 hypothetical protein A1O9_09695 [Exophiala aquamarina CBS 119918]